MTDYKLPVGIISEAKDPMNILGDFVAWMENQGDDLFITMNGHNREAGGGYGRWLPEGFHFSPDDTDDSGFVFAIFDAMKDLSPLLPKDHMFGWSEGAFGIFYCPIKIIVEPEDRPGFIPLARLKRLHRQFEIIEKAQKEIYGEMLDIRDKAETYQDADSVWIAVAAELASRMEAGKFSMGHILRQITRAIMRRS